MKNYINEFIHYSTTNRIIDQVYTNSSCVSKSGVLDWNVSDHLPVYIARKKQIILEFEGRSYIQYSKEALSNWLLDQDWNRFNMLKNVNVQWLMIKKEIRKAVDILAPVHSFIFKKNRPTWFTDELMEILRDKDTLMSHARKTKDQIDIEIAKQTRNKANSLIKSAKADYIKEQLNQNKN